MRASAPSAWTTSASNWPPRAETSTAARAWSPFTGRQVEIRQGLQRATVVEFGGGLREYELDGQPIVDGYPADSMADGGRGISLLPWPNRLADGQYTFDGQTHQVAIDEVGRHNAIHGLTRSLNWNVAEQATDRVRMAVTVHPRHGYPFALELSIEYALDAAGLTIRTTAHNVGSRPLPYGAGQHPYFTVGTALVDPAVLHLPAPARLELDEERRLPTGTVLPVAGSAFDFRTPREIGPLILDDCYTDLDRGADGVARMSLSDPRTQRQVEVWLDAGYRYVQVFSGDTLPTAQRRRSLAIEPMTCPPNAFRTGVDLIVLQPDESRSVAWGVAQGPSRAA